MAITASREFQTIGVLTTLCAALAAPHASAAVPASALESAKTIQVQETLLIPNQAQKLVPLYQISVRIAKPGKIRIDLAHVTAGAGAPKHSSYFVTDGKTAHEYNGPSNQFVTSDAPAPGTPVQSQAYNIAAVDSILNPNDKPDARAGVKRTSTPDTLDGHKLTLITDAYPPRPGRGGAPVTFIEKKWTDAKTGLPYRLAAYAKQGAKLTVMQQLNFTSWTLNKAIPAAQFAWAPPAGAKEYSEPKLLTAGAVAPDFTATAPDGTPVKLSDYKGKIVVLDFWATWCGPCQASMPHLQHVYDQVKDKNVAVLGVCVWDDKDAYTKWLADKKGVYSFPTAFDPAAKGPQSIAGALYHVSGIPTQYIIDKDGKVSATTVGYDDGDHQLEDALGKLGVTVPIAPKTADAK
ncbi:hypothetical protein CCAX7_006420 [Capsulimonas corticalis]|uniref:Uncharacterized protein n=1 Tax=Capsulimonas corticalis TaxID=2219043 RepID=A0A402D3D8_9BACT|nr:redoxin domain-containing protein [Capsulimonas corticalis]BDI28591.1 hypothetical protein CCAX7_006420 [Capsulimonas corticalis]